MYLTKSRCGFVNTNYQVKPYTYKKYQKLLSLSVVLSTKIGTRLVHHSCHRSKNEHNCFTVNCMYMNDAGYEFIPVLSEMVIFKCLKFYIVQSMSECSSLAKVLKTLCVKSVKCRFYCINSDCSLLWNVNLVVTCSAENKRGTFITK
jgi:hypothetical protein